MTYVRTNWLPKGDPNQTLVTAARLNNIEQGIVDAHGVKSGELTNAPSWSMSIDGEAVRAVRVAVVGALVTAPAAEVCRIRPNGGVPTTWFENTMAWWGQDINNVNISGQVVNAGAGYGWQFAETVFGVPCSISAHGVLRLKTGMARAYRGDYGGSPLANDNRKSVQTTTGNWEDTTTAITSLLFDFGGATFTGDIRVESLT